MTYVILRYILDIFNALFKKNPLKTKMYYHRVKRQVIQNKSYFIR